MKYIGLCIIGLVVAISLPAQKIHVLPSDSAVKTGVLPNGMTYYVASNPDFKGMADFALVQRAGLSNLEGVSAEETASLPSSLLADCPRFLQGSVQDFFVRQGALPGKNGFAEITENATIYRFSNIMLSSAAVMDSTLLVRFNMADRSAFLANDGLKGYLAPSDHAVVVSGDVAADALVEKMKMLSYMIPVAESLQRKEYVWADREFLELCKGETTRETVTISAEWRIQPTPREYMHTVQPTMLERFIAKLGIIAKDRVIKEFQSAGVPLADVTSGYMNVLQTHGDEKFEVSISVRPSDVSFAVKTMASVMGALDNGAVNAAELKRAGRIFLSQNYQPKDSFDGNAEYVDRCISAFVYNSSLASRHSVLAFQTSHILDEVVELKIFNTIASASLDPRKNITLKSDSPDVDMDSLAGEFNQYWTAAGSNVPSDPSGTITMPVPGEPLKMKSMRKEHVSGGSIWTLSNGLRVIFKNMPIDNIQYSLALNGGYGNISGLQRGEGIYLSEYLRFCRIGGLSFNDFQDVIGQNGMTMDCNVNISNMIFKGSIPSDEVEYLLKMLAAVMYDRTLDKEAFDYYLACEPVRIDHMKGTIQERISAIDSLLCPDYKFSACRAAGALQPAFADKAEAFMKSQAAKMNDGVLILVGNIDERKLRSALMTQGSRFSTSERKFSRPVINYQMMSGSMTYMLDGEHQSADIVMSTPMAFTSDNYYTAAIASMIMRKRLSAAVMGKCVHLTMNHRCLIYPQERCNVMITLEDAPISGYACGTSTDDPEQALRAVYAVLSDMGTMEISNVELSFYKELLKKQMIMQKTDPEYWLKTIAMRYLDGKDFSTDCDSRIDAITADKVRTVLSSLNKGSRVEYIINGK